MDGPSGVRGPISALIGAAGALSWVCGARQKRQAQHCSGGTERGWGGVTAVAGDVNRSAFVAAGGLDGREPTERPARASRAVPRWSAEHGGHGRRARCGSREGRLERPAVVRAMKRAARRRRHTGR